MTLLAPAFVHANSEIICSLTSQVACFSFLSFLGESTERANKVLILCITRHLMSPGWNRHSGLLMFAQAKQNKTKKLPM